jgi:hypothetical protein
MFCPKCGESNPDNGKFCRACGTNLGGVSSALAGTSNGQSSQLVDRKGKPVSWEGAITRSFMGIAFMVISISLAVTGAGRGWWFWLLIPAFMMIGSGIAQIFQLKRIEAGKAVYVPDSNEQLKGGANHSLPSPQTEWVAPESRYKTGDLVPPSVTDATTRNLEVDKEGQTMTLPKK